MEPTPLVRPETATGNERFVVVPSPTCPWAFRPQHFTAPPLVSAHDDSEPTVISTMPVSGVPPEQSNPEPLAQTLLA